MTEENPVQPPVSGTQSPTEASRGLDRIRKAAREPARLNNLLHHVTAEMLRHSYGALKRDAATGVDEVTWREYGEGLAERLAALHARVQSGRYRAQPSRRLYIPKPDGRQRPIGVAALEDKIVQKALAEVLGAIWEGDFANFSYGFRPGRSQHDALDALWVGITQRKVNWVLDADIRSFFDTLDHGWLMKFVEHRVSDPRVLRLLRKWLRAGVSEDGQWTPTTVGTPQGAVISPLLANIFLHYALDLWVRKWRREKAKGEVIIVRYADDFVMGFQHEQDALRFRAALAERMKQFALELHESKTRLIEFGRFAIANRKEREAGRPETFDFLGFTHICAQRRSDGKFTVWRRTIGKKMRAKLAELGKELKRWRHAPVPQVGQWLRSVVNGYFNYHAVPDNLQRMNRFRREVSRRWLKALRRRSQKGRNMTWTRMQRYIDRWLPPVRLRHPYPNQRLRVEYPR